MAAWIAVDSPHTALPNDAWLSMFRAAGYTCNGEPATPPATVTLYRGAPPQWRDNWSWTTHAYAAWIASLQTHTGQLWTTTATAEHLLAESRTGQGFVEYVAQTEGLEIKPQRMPYMTAGTVSWRP